MKRIVIYPLLFFFTFNPLAFYVMLEWHKIRMAMELEKSNEKGRFTVLMIPFHDTAGTFHWNDKNEISYQGKFYDVIKQERKGGHMVFYCIRDKDEETLLSFMKKLTGHKYFTFQPDDVVKIIPSVIRPALLNPSSECQFPALIMKMESISPGALTPPPKPS
jgi:hypothetical protein